MAISLSATYFLVTLGIVCYFVARRAKHKRSVPLPPGPPADPIIGHLRSLPTAASEETLIDWHRTYGDVLYFNILGTSIVLLNSEKVGLDLLEDRAKIYSDRPHVPFVSFIGWGKVLPMLPYDNEFYKARKLFQEFLSRSACSNYRDIQVSHVHTALKKLLQSPEKFASHVARFAGGIIVELGYGHRITNDDDPYLALTEEINRLVSLQGQAGSHPIDIFPFLRFLPSWFPGAGFIRFAKEARDTLEIVKSRPIEDVEKSLAEDTALPSFVATNLEDLRREHPEANEDLEILKNAALIFYAGGAETTSSTIENILFALLLHPEVQARAQREIDNVLGQKRLPDFSDRENIPYIEHIIQEGMRWRPAVPLGIPHRVMADDVYQGKLIPKGSIVISNIRCMTMDDNVYQNPLAFSPERYIPAPEGNGEPYPPLVFGFGRRVCPGRHLAEASVWIFVATFIAAFEIVPLQDEKGNNIIPKPEFLNGITSRPKPFKCTIRPRSPKTKALVEQL
ncbi:hypothetical protein NLI96_g1814 [Meripilus lineatus]|uniref:Cytochrome P450 n=1 Tax=Meripilus lineatus TaxID=2056292 RepID=A0AAD5VF85_9APHY|nr:hypothetical protein NLI96_g1814 [Physisporinus lineatus]